MVERITYQNPENGYSVLKCRVKDYSELVPVIGNMIDVNVGSVLVCDGNWKVDAKYGRQFVAENWEALVDIDEKIKSIQQKAGKGIVGYYGVAHIPFAFLAGYDFGDQSKIHIFHRKRHNDEVFEELSEGANYDLRFDIEEKQKNSAY